MAIAIGFRAKTGRAIAVVLAGTADDPHFVLRREVSLVDPSIPATRQPYHEAMELPWPDVPSFVKPLVDAVGNVASAALASLLRELASRDVAGIGIVGSPDRSLHRFGNPHIRAHAAEGMLFRSVLEMAAKSHSIPSRTFGEKDVAHFATAELGLSAARLASRLKKLGTEAGPPWRSDEKAAATSAWLMLRPSA
jgi:hypothetical protein